MNAQKLFFVLALFSAQLLSAPYFNKTSPEWDENCPTWDIHRFRNVETYFTIGVEGAQSFGFDLEADITREGVDLVLCALDSDYWETHEYCKKNIFFNSHRPFKKFDQEQAVGEYYKQYDDLEEQFEIYLEYIEDWLKVETHSYFNVGNILEYLTRMQLQKLDNIYPPDRFTITGGVTYFHGKGSNMVGELDIVVYNNRSCRVVAIGESKASANSNMKDALRKAKKQLKRFEDFSELYKF